MMMKEWWTLMMSRRPHNCGPRQEDPSRSGKDLPISEGLLSGNLRIVGASW